LLLKQLLLSCNRYCTFRPNPLSVSSNGNEDMLKATHFIADHYQQPISLDEIAAQVNLSPAYLSKKFHNTIGKTISEYLNSERLKHAALELISTKHSITEIALNSGFNDANYFKDVFKKTFGISPRDYRKRREAVYQTDTKIVTATDDELLNSEAEVS
ncbi:MAG: helix-turn-helix transcriptional regulator, partial [Lachnospiraceae bacterium]|nr:helix-turn-helix transcriptional regulator [Lachnospiraceae bacterium]